MTGPEWAKYAQEQRANGYKDGVNNAKFDIRQLLGIDQIVDELMERIAALESRLDRLEDEE